MSGWSVAIVGATGAVGETLLGVLRDRSFPVRRLQLLASARSAGAEVEVGGLGGGDRLPVEVAVPAAFEGVDVAFFATSAEISRTLAPEALAHGALVVDKSSAFRSDPDVPLVVPEVNPEQVDGRRLLASPNCSTIQLVVALKPLLDGWGLGRVVVSSYQSVSGTGREAMEELESLAHRHLHRVAGEPAVYPRSIAFDVLPQCDRFADDGFTLEEHKFVNESRRILGQPSLAISATAVRVPVFVGHAESVWVETEREFELGDVLAALEQAPGVQLLRDPSGYPTPRQAAGRDSVLVGRVRRDPTHPRGLWLWVVADNLRKGAATNAVQIAELALGRARAATSDRQEVPR